MPLVIEEEVPVKNKRGRPRSVPMEGWVLPIPKTDVPGKPYVKDPNVLFAYWSGPLRAFDQPDSTKPGSYRVYVYREIPVCDNSLIDLDHAYERVYETWPFGDKCKDAREGFIAAHGSGVYRIQIIDLEYNNSSDAVNGTILTTKFAFQDLVNHPPRLNLKSLNMGDTRNKDYIRYCRQRGIKLPGDEGFGEEGKSKMSELEKTVFDAAVTKLVHGNDDGATRELSGLARDMMARSDEHTRTLMEVLASNKNSSTGDIMPIVTLMQGQMQALTAQCQSQLDSQRQSYQAMLDSARRDLDSLRDSKQREIDGLREEVRELRRQLDSKEQPKSLIEQAEELAKLESMFQHRRGRIIQPPAPPQPEGPPSWLMPALALAAPILERYFGSSLSPTAALGLNTPTTIAGTLAATNLPPSPAIPAQQPPATTSEVPVSKLGLQLYGKETAQKLMLGFNAILTTLQEPLWNHLIDPELNGEDFAGWFIDGHGQANYDMVRRAAKMDLVAAIQCHPYLGGQIEQAGIKHDQLNEFVDRFLNAEKIWQEAEAAAAVTAPEPTKVQ